MQVFKVISVLATCIIYCDSANILAFPTFPGYSHFIIAEPLLKSLAERGHNVTVVSYFPQKKPVKNYIDIDVSYTLPLVTDNISIEFALQNMRNNFDCMLFVYNLGYKMCESIFKDKVVQDMINTTHVQYDLVITEIFGADCFTAFAYKYKLPLISIATTVGVPWSNGRIKNPDNPAYIANYFRPVKDKITLYDRIMNTVTLLTAKTGYHFLSDVPAHELAKKYFGESLPPLYDIYKNTALIMTNTHYSYRQIQPFLPNVIEIGGIHLKNSTRLTKELKQILDESNNGVILLTLGSMLRCSTLPEHILKAFIKVFSKIPHRILWKIEDEVPNIPSNVITRKWVPVKEVLEHPNVKLLIMHGGMATTIETINAGVPVVGIPMYGDQPGNIQSLVNKGVAIEVDYFDITEETLYNAVYNVLNDPSFTENAKKLSVIFKDRENSPLDTAVYWTEYVIRHKGAPHLQSPAVNLSWYQLMLLDIIFIGFSVIIFIILILYSTFKILRNIICKPSNKKRKQA